MEDSSIQEDMILLKWVDINLNNKLHVGERLENQILVEPIVDTETGEILVEKGTKLTREIIDEIYEELGTSAKQLSLK